MNLRRLVIQLTMVLLVVAIAAPAATAQPLTKCRMSFTLKEWAALYKKADGMGEIVCDNGQRADVKIEARGGGLSAGKGEIRDGKGKFSNVGDIKELFGSYAQAEAGAGAVKNAEATALTKGSVSLGLEGKGTGWELGVSFGKFTIIPR
jgi:hypothetical protein